MKDSGAEDDVEFLFSREVQQVELLRCYPLPEWQQRLAGLFYHVLGSIYGCDLCLGKSFHQFSSHAAGATTCIKDALITAQA